MANTPILGPDGRPFGSPLGKPPMKQVSPEEYCSMVLASYINDMANAGVDPVNALAEMGAQLPAMLVGLAKAAGNTVESTKEPMEFLLKRIADVCWKLGFRVFFASGYAGEPGVDKDKDKKDQNTDKNKVENKPVETDKKELNLDEPDTKGE